MSMHTDNVTAHAEAGHGHEQDHGGPGVYIRTLVTLLILTVVTVAAAGIHFESSAVNVVIALAIATVKATLVALFFMHLRWDKPVNAIIAMGGFLFLGIFLLFTLLDFGTRQNLQPFNIKAPVMTLIPGASPYPKGSKEEKEIQALEEAKAKADAAAAAAAAAGQK